MKLRFIGTGKGECKIRKVLSKEYRRSCGLIIDDCLLIDPTVAAFDFIDHFGLDGLYSKVKEVLLTSSEYLCEEALLRLARFKKIKLFAHTALSALVPQNKNIEFVPLSPLSFTVVGAYKVLALPTTHRTEYAKEVCLSYAISKDKSVFYAPSGALITPNTSMVLQGIHLDGAIIGCGGGLMPPSVSMQDNNFDMALIVKDMLTSSGIMNSGAKIIITNIPTDKKKTLHEDMCELSEEKGVTIAYDGYFVNV